MEKYNHQAIETKWQKFWLDNKVFKTNDSVSGDKSYVLDMFPYPSAAGLHVGHPEGYTATDIYCRYLRHQGVNVLHPMGWDAFGLPAENYAIKTGAHPRELTWQNIDNFRRQIQSLGFSYDWDREVNTAAPEYYRWTQWLFLQLYNKGLAYQKEALVNWCNSCQTVLANEQVVAGECDRCHNLVEQRLMSQWFFKITDYADRLLKDLTGLDWPPAIIDMQKNWIGESKGAEVNFPIVDTNIKKFIILHGHSGPSTSLFIPWLKVELEKELEHKFREAAMKKYSYKKGSLQKAAKEALSNWIMQQSTRVPKVKDPFKLVRGMLSDLKGKTTSVELQHEATKIWAKKYL